MKWYVLVAFLLIVTAVFADTTTTEPTTTSTTTTITTTSSTTTTTEAGHGNGNQNNGEEQTIGGQIRVVTEDENEEIECEDLTLSECLRSKRCRVVWEPSECAEEDEECKTDVVFKECVEKEKALLNRTRLKIRVKQVVKDRIRERIRVATAERIRARIVSAYIHNLQEIAAESNTTLGQLISNMSRNINKSAVSIEKVENEIRYPGMFLRLRYWFFGGDSEAADEIDEEAETMEQEVEQLEEVSEEVDVETQELMEEQTLGIKERIQELRQLALEERQRRGLLSFLFGR